MTVRLAYNLRLLAQYTAGVAPNLAEAMAMKIKDGRHYMYIAHEHGPAGFYARKAGNVSVDRVFLRWVPCQLNLRTLS